MEARGRLLACCAHSTVAARVEARLATGGMGTSLPWIVSAPLTVVLDLWFLACGTGTARAGRRRGAQPNQGVGTERRNGVAARFACNRGEQ